MAAGPAAPATADAVGYRLAGIMAVGADYLGFLELPDGEQVLVRQGSTLSGGGRVVSIQARRLRIALPGRHIDLSLEGSGQARSAAPSRSAVVEQSDYGDTVLTRSVDLGRFSEAVSGAGTGKPDPSAAGKKSSDPGSDAGRRLAPIVDLPPNARIVSVSGQPVTSADQAIATIQKMLQDGVAPILSLAGAPGEPASNVYLSLAQDPARAD